MTDDKGPYKELSETCIEGPGFESLPQKVFKDLDMVVLLNLAYAEGRKAAEKDFKELLEFANWIEEFYPGRYEHVERFKAWKKARGIE